MVSVHATAARVSANYCPVTLSSLLYLVSTAAFCTFPCFEMLWWRFDSPWKFDCPSRNTHLLRYD